MKLNKTEYALILVLLCLALELCLPVIKAFSAPISKSDAKYFDSLCKAKFGDLAEFDSTELVNDSSVVCKVYTSEVVYYFAEAHVNNLIGWSK